MALIMVLIVLSTLAVIGTPFVLSMVLRDRASQGFAGKVRAYQAAVMARNHAIARLEETSYPEELAREWEAVSSDEERSRLTPARSRTSSSEGG
ncbi:MAG TPA: hypothetical protein VK116_03790, partial [Planctomycetota bacterium]|nr:hypothetical protein [Planctomycetota bacterium]